jgi:hypothetical protein
VLLGEGCTCPAGNSSTGPVGVLLSPLLLLQADLAVMVRQCLCSAAILTVFTCPAKNQACINHSILIFVLLLLLLLLLLLQALLAVVVWWHQPG